MTYQITINGKVRHFDTLADAKAAAQVIWETVHVIVGIEYRAK